MPEAPLLYRGRYCGDMGRARGGQRLAEIGGATLRSRPDLTVADLRDDGFARVFGGGRGSADPDPERDLIGSTRFRNRQRCLEVFGQHQRERVDNRGVVAVLCAIDSTNEAPFMVVDGAYYDLAAVVEILAERSFFSSCYIDLDVEGAPILVFGAIGESARRMHPTGLSLHDDLTAASLYAAIGKTRGLPGF